jgi:hypothetical protein
MKGGYSGSTGKIISPGEELLSRLGSDKLVWSLGTSKNDTDQIPAAVYGASASDRNFVVEHCFLHTRTFLEEAHLKMHVV